MNESRGCACELVAWQFLTYLDERDLIEYLLYELPAGEVRHRQTLDAETSQHSHSQNRSDDRDPDESTALLHNEEGHRSPMRPPQNPRAGTLALDLDLDDVEVPHDSQGEDPTAPFGGLNGGYPDLDASKWLCTLHASPKVLWV